MTERKLYVKLSTSRESSLMDTIAIKYRHEQRNSTKIITFEEN